MSRWCLLPLMSLSQGQRTPCTRDSRFSGGREVSVTLLAEWGAAFSWLAFFCDFEGKALLRTLLPIPPFIYSFIQQVLSPVAEHKGSTSYNHILHLCRIFIPCKITSPFLFCLPRGFYSIIEETGLILLYQLCP